MKLEKLLVLTQRQVFRYLLEVLPSYEVVGTTIIYKTELTNKIKPVLCAHMDTVSKCPPSKKDIIKSGDFIILDKNSESTCLGGDDRCGVFALLSIIKSEHRDKYNYLFFSDEEVGCVGSSNFTLSQEFYDLDEITSVYIDVDRRCSPDNPEIATYDYDDMDLIDIVSDQLPHFKFTSGAITDCSILSEYSDSRTPCMNFSAGYNGEHTRNETIHLPSLYTTIEALKSLEIPEELFEYEVETIISNKYSTNYSTNYIKLKPIVCDYCGAHEYLFESPDGFNYICEDCYYANFTDFEEVGR